MKHHSKPLPNSSSVFSLRTLALCVGLIVIPLVAYFIFKVSVNTIFFYGIVLVCPLLHIFMMKGGHKH